MDNYEDLIKRKLELEINDLNRPWIAKNLSVIATIISAIVTLTIGLLSYHAIDRSGFFDNQISKLNKEKDSLLSVNKKVYNDLNSLDKKLKAKSYLLKLVVDSLNNIDFLDSIRKGRQYLYFRNMYRYVTKDSKLTKFIMTINSNKNLDSFLKANKFRYVVLKNNYIDSLVLDSLLKFNPPDLQREGIWIYDKKIFFKDEYWRNQYNDSYLMTKKLYSTVANTRS